MSLLFEPLFLLGLLMAISALVVARTAVEPDERDESFPGEIVDDFPTEVLLSPGKALGEAGKRVGDAPSMPPRGRRTVLEKDTLL